MTPQASDYEFEAQDRAEILDETHLVEDGDDIANFDAAPDVYDATRAEDDDDLDDVDSEDGAFDDDDVAEINDDLDAARDDEGRDIERQPLTADADKPSDHEPSAHPEETVAPNADPHIDKQLDKGLKETFPASDPVSINPGAD
ncbi:MAG TPA: primosomal protein [Caulobacter sp.]|nr:primosomal protein [Caulobacter sp.]